MDFVLDASVTLAWCFGDEATPGTVELLNVLETESAFVPAIWSLEVGNVLMGAERRKRISYAQITEFLTLLKNLNLEVDTEAATNGFHEILSLAYSQKLTTYDAAYLELAMRLGLPLATKDNALKAAAQQLGISLIEC